MSIQQRGSILLPTMILTTLALFLLVSLWEIVGLYQSVNRRADTLITINQSIDQFLQTTEQAIIELPPWQLPLGDTKQMPIHAKYALVGAWWSAEKTSDISFWEEHASLTFNNNEGIQHYAIVEHYDTQCDVRSTTDSNACLLIFRITIRSETTQGITLHTQTLLSRR